MSDISLTASMRTNLLSLQNTQSLMDQTQERLSTGLKVNSAIDNASSYYTAQSLNNRASDLNSLLDSMGQGVQTIKAANEGIEAITKFVTPMEIISKNYLCLIAVFSMMILTITGWDRFIPLFGLPSEPQVRLKKNVAAPER